MSEQLLINWLRKETGKIDLIISEAARAFTAKNESKYNFSYDLNECQHESYLLSEGHDLCYDRPNTAFVYSLWHHPKRINTFLGFFLKPFLNNTKSRIEIFDLGAGTGAVQFAIALILEGMRQINLKPPTVKIVNIDSSPVMLNYGKDYLHAQLLIAYPNSKVIETEYCLTSWNLQSAQTFTNPWIVASYLFDSTENHTIVSDDFLKIVTKYKPEKLILLSASRKSAIVRAVAQRCKSLNYVYEEVALNQLTLQGNLSEVNKLRAELYTKFSSYGMNRFVDWHEHWFFGLNLTSTSSQLDLGISSKKEENTSIDLHTKRIKIWKEEDLSEPQKKAYRFHGRPSIILGPAGSGKSVVITEKIRYLIKEKDYSPSLKILFTTFNKGLTEKIGDWLELLLDREKFKRSFYENTYYGKSTQLESSIFSFKEGINNLYLLNIDLLPSRLGSIGGSLTFEDRLHRILEDIVPVVKEELGLGSEYDEILTPKFLHDEFYKIIYGRLIPNKESYLSVARTGMWKPLGQKQREVVYDVIFEFKEYLKEKGHQTKYCKRESFLKKLENGPEFKFDYVFVDEFQDFTETDYKIIFNLIKDVNNVTFAGDLAQSIHTGHAAHVPRDKDMSNIQKLYLEGSYRVPFRICECLSDISSEIAKRFRNSDGAQILAPVKNSPPGARPIVVYAKTLGEIVTKIAQVWNEYLHFGLTEVSILEKDDDLKVGLKQNRIPTETYTILSMKGLERDCILWATHISVNDIDEVYEFVYTILTRASNVIIIAITDQTHEYYKKVLKKLRRDRLILYDQETKSVYDTFLESDDTIVPDE